MSTEYQAQDEALEDELRALYAQDAETEQESDSPSDEGTESQEEPSSSQDPSDEGTQAEDEQAESTPAPQDTVDKSRYDNAVVAMNKAQQELAERRKQDTERDNQIQHLQQQLQLQAQQFTELQAAKQTQASTPELDDDDLDEANELYPELVKPILKRNANLERKIADLEARLDKRLTDVSNDVGQVKHVADRYQKTEAEMADQRFWETVSQKHTDAQTLNVLPEFIDWYNDQSNTVKHLGQSGDPRDAVMLFDQFRASNPKPVSDTARPLEKDTSKVQADKLAAAKEAAGPNVRSSQRTDKTPTYTNEQISKMTPQMFNKHEAAILEAMTRGEIT